MKDYKEEANKGTLEVFNKADNIVELVKEGFLKATNAFMLLKKIEAKAKILREEIAELTKEELSQIGEEGKLYKIEGGSLELRNSAGRWDFSNNEEIVRKEEELKELKERSKSAYKMSLKGSILVTEDGEEVTPAIFKGGKETIVVKISK